MILDYLQFFYGGEYSEYSIEIPNGALVFKVANNYVSYKYNDTWTYNILILSKEPIEELDNICLGEWYLTIIDCVYSEYNFNNINEFPKIEFYIIKSNFDKVDKSLPIEIIEKESIYKIYKFKGIDFDNIYFSCVTIKNPIMMEDSYLLGYDTYDVDILLGNRTKIKYGNKYKKLYEELCNKVINKII